MNIRVLPSLKIAVAFSDVRSAMAGTFDPNKTPGPIKVVDTKDNMGSIKGIVSWGEDNLFPNKLNKVIKSNSKLQKGLALTALELLGGGVRTGILSVDEETGEEYFKPQAFKDYHEWERRADSFRQYGMLAARNLKAHFNCFVSIVLTGDRKKIAIIKTIPAELCRVTEPRPDGSSEFVAVSSYWEEGVNPNDTQKVKVIRLVPDWWFLAETLQYLVDNTTDTEFMLHLRMPTDELTYSLPDYYAVITQGWVNVSNNVPVFKEWIMKNLTDFNNILYIREEYFELKYPDWKKLLAKAEKGDKDAAQTIIDRQGEVIKYIEDKLAGAVNSGKLITAPLIKSAAGKELAKSIVIEKIETNNFDGKYNADAQEADNQILFGIGVDPSRYGSAPGTSRQGGSDKREAHNIGQIMEASAEHILMTPYRLLRDFNKYNPDMEFQIRRGMLQTLDKVPPAQRETTLETEPKNN